MKFIDNRKLTLKLPLMMVGIAMTAMTIMGFQAYRDARALLDVEGNNRLDGTLNARAEQLLTWQDVLIGDVRAEAASQSTARALREFSSAWKRLGADASGYVRKLYVDENPNPAGERQLLDFAGDITDYSIQHRRYHNSYVTAAQQKGFYDVFLVDTSGNVLYTMAKESDFGSNLLTGEYKDTPLGEVVRQALSATDDTPIVSELRQYAPSNGDPAAFVAAPVRATNGDIQGVYAVQLPLDRIDAAMSNPAALGNTGEGYLVGPDHLMMSNLRLSATPTVLARTLESKAVLAALKGETGTTDEIGANGMPSRLVYRPVHLLQRDLALVVEQSSNELFAPAVSLAEKMIMNAGMLLVLMVALSWFLARNIARPLTFLRAAMDRIAAKELSTAVPYSTRGDEVGQMARALESFRGELIQGEAVAEEGALKGAAFEGSSAALMMTDNAFNITYVNGSVRELIRNRLTEFRKINPEIDPDTLIGRNIDVFHSQAARINAIISDPARLPFQAELRIGDGRFSVEVNEVQQAERGRIGLVVEWRDITAEMMNRALLGAIDAHQLMVEFSAGGALSKINDNAVTCLGTSSGEMLHKPLNDVLAQIEADGQEHPVQMAAGAREPITGRFALRDVKGHEVLVEGSLNPVLDRNGNLVRMVLMAVDVTEAQRLLRTAEAERAEMLKSQNVVVDQLRIGLQNLSAGDLTTRIETRFREEYEQLRADFNAAADNLRQAMSIVIENAGSIEGEAREISNAAEDLSRRTEQQAATLEETAAALDQLTSSVTSAAEGAKDANRVVTEARSSAEASGEVVKQAVAAMGEIESSSAKISKIISVIDDIAFQTNLLALNAGVEAARAGEAGRGFAVVASEVRALAQRSSEAAREIDGLISDSGNHVRRGVSLVGETGQALEGILASVIDISARVSQIAGAASEQSSGLAEINVAVNQLDQVTQQNAAMFEQTTAASHSLTRGAQSLTETTSQFRIGTPVAAAPAAAPRRAPVSTGAKAANPVKPAVARAPAPVTKGAPAFNSRRTAPPPSTQGALAIKHTAEPSGDDWVDF
jgi:methyl-accepting chemotaxis protein